MANTTSTDRVAAYLGEVKRRAADERRDVGLAPDDALSCADDIPRLVAAVERVLEKHQPILRGETICAVCRLAVDSNFEHPWPCPTYRAISEALTGEEGTDG